MFGLKKTKTTDNDIMVMQATINAISKSQAVIEFTPEGVIQTANENFLRAVGYTLGEIQGQHHRIFVDPAYGASYEYKAFWDALKRGEYQSAEYKRLGKNGKEIWIQATYNPVLDSRGRTFKVIKFATDITDQKLQNADFAGQIDAISKSQAIIHFNLDGTIITANQNFLNAMGYTLGEIQGQHHRMFVEPNESNSYEYKVFWDALRRGEYQAAEYKRLGKGGKEVWIQATYNPIIDSANKVIKIIKIATETTEQKMRNAEYSGQIDALSKSQAVIHFNMDGTVTSANDNFLRTVGYTLSEVQGQHHRMFVTQEYASNESYKQFWDSLKRGEIQAGEFLRYGKGGKEVWIQASYNPIMDLNGKPFKVVKYATDITIPVKSRTENERIRAIIDSNLSTIEGSVEKAYQKTAAADTATQTLTNKAQSMGGIIDTIDAITERINLLSLNASIEAARAGDAGRGFGVVANEVKNLANQAATTTSKISEEVTNMQAVSKEVVNALASISELTTSVRDNVTSVARSISSQG